MAYFKINNTDISQYVSGLKVSKAANYSAQTNAAGNTVVDYINTKRTIEVTVIPIDDAAMRTIETLLANINVLITYREPRTGTLTTLTAIIPAHEIEYYTIQAGNVMYNAMELTFTEL